MHTLHCLSRPRFLLLVWAICLSNIFLFGLCHDSLGQDSDALIRRDLKVAPEKLAATSNSLQQLFRNAAHPHPAKPNAILIQIGQDSVSMEVQNNASLLRFEGPSRIVNEIAALGSVLASNSRDTYRILSLNDNGQASLNQFSASAPHKTLNGIQKIPSFLGLKQESPKKRGPKTKDSNPVQLASGFNAQDPPAETPLRLNGNPPLDDKNQKNDGDGGPTLPLPQFEGVQIEMLPELDAVILRGRDQQLNDLSEIIKRLDEASRLTRPEIEVVQLEHVNSESLAKLITATQEKLTGNRQGRIFVTALGKPNAVLLIGWGESLAATKELIQKLDQPSAPDGQFAVIPLQHAMASEVQTQIQSMFKNRDGLVPLIQSIADNRSNAIIVNASPRDLQEIKMLIQQIDVPRGGLMQQAKVFQLRHTLAADIAKSLLAALTSTTTERNTSVQLLDENGRPLATSGILGSTKITINERNNTLIVACPPENLALVERLIEQLDTPGDVAKIKIFPIRNGDASALVETLRSLLPTASTTSQASTQLSSNPNESSLLPLRFTVDSRGNNIIAIGSEGDLKIVEALILRLDESDSMQRKSMVYALKNSPAVDVALAINEFLRSKRQVEIAAPGSSNPFEQLEKEVVVVPEPVQNKLILSATPRYYDEISKLIEELDQQPPQVMIQVMIAEITLGNTDEFGVEMGLQDSVLFDRSLLGNLATRTNTTTTSTPAGVVTDTTQEIVAASNTPGFNFNNSDPLGNSGSGRALASSGRVGGQGLSNFTVGRTNDALGFGGLVLSASSENVSFLLRALQDSRRLEILSRPQVLTLDNQEAFIQVGQRVPRIASSIINQNGAQNVLQLEPVGLIIGVTPRISPEGNVVMEIDAEKSKLGPEAEGIPVSISANGTVIRSPRYDTITAQATVSAADGETIILGGLISRSNKTIHRQVPFLGNLPLLKHLFSYDFTEFQRTELLIIMTPHVIRTQGDMERLKQAEFARMSWCEADVFEVHGDVFAHNGITPDMLNQEDCPVVYPDVDPRGASQSGRNTPAVNGPMTSGPARLNFGEPIPLSSNVPGNNVPSNNIPNNSLPNGPSVIGTGVQPVSATSVQPSQGFAPLGTNPNWNGEQRR